MWFADWLTLFSHLIDYCVGMSSTSGKSTLQSYILRVWSEGGDSAENDPAIRVSLTAIPSGRRYGFGSLDDAFRFLVTQLHPTQIVEIDMPQTE